MSIDIDFIASLITEDIDFFNKSMIAEQCEDINFTDYIFSDGDDDSVDFDFIINEMLLNEDNFSVKRNNILKYFISKKVVWIGTLNPPDGRPKKGMQYFNHAAMLMKINSIERKYAFLPFHHFNIREAIVKVPSGDNTPYIFYGSIKPYFNIETGTSGFTLDPIIFWDILKDHSAELYKAYQREKSTFDIENTLKDIDNAKTTYNSLNTWASDVSKDSTPIGDECANTDCLKELPWNSDSPYCNDCKEKREKTCDFCDEIYDKKLSKAPVKTKQLFICDNCRKKVNDISRISRMVPSDADYIKWQEEKTYKPHIPAA